MNYKYKMSKDDPLEHDDEQQNRCCRRKCIVLFT